jgi:hypothetical protein
MPPKTGPIPQEFLEPALYSSGMTARTAAPYCAGANGKLSYRGTAKSFCLANLEKPTLHPD